MDISIFTDRRMIEHDVPGQHPECPERLRAILRHLERTGFLDACPSGSVRQATMEELQRVHSVDYIEEVAGLEARGGGALDADTWVFCHSNEAARLAAGACIEAASHVMSGTDRRALCLVRPPGHHALPAAGMGFCIFSNAALAAQEALARFQVGRILIVDFDVHHGNGTQAIFYESSKVAFLSIHRYPFYPGTGARSETGSGAGLGSTLNIPLPYNTPRSTYHAAFRAGLHTLADRIKPELIIISAGFDAHVEDPVGGLGLEIEDFEILTKEVVGVAETHAQGRILSVLEGGYNIPILAGSVEAHLHALGVEPLRR
jgi:acetoin utilization deacetylase AcuC-like enzyme